jgi:hypothetical protein
MIRKLKSEEYRLYSRQKDPKQESAETSAPSAAATRPKRRSAQCGTSSGNNRRRPDRAVQRFSRERRNLFFAC